MDTAELSTQQSLNLITAEVSGIVADLQGQSPESFDAAIDLLESAPRIFVVGAGRSGLALRMTAMRLMHLGLEVFVVGDVTTPAIAAGDVLVAASGSGTTGGIVRAATSAVSVGANVLAITTAPQSPLAELSAVTIVIPAAQKQDHRGALTAQYSGSLFEQTLVLLGDSIFHALWQRTGVDAEELWPRHANLE